jgi:aminoglycoside/choline kinase family phosphotransferase
VNQEVISLIEENLNLSNLNFIKMSGDASAREYFSVNSNEGKYILCLEQPNGQQSTDFIKMNSVLPGSIKRPEVLYYNLEVSMLLQQDLGDISLNKVIALSDTDKREDLFKKCIDDIFKYQSVDIQSFKIFDNRAFDKEKIGFEFDLATKFFIEEYLNNEITSNVSAVLSVTRKFFVDYFESNRNVICHRDYHGRNLIFNNGEIFHIDFQDARIGPETYDLCSLLEDCYFLVNTELKNKLLQYFFDKQSKYNSYEEFISNYRIVAAQRLFKAIGSFTYLTIDKNKKGYEKNIGYAFENLREILETVPELTAFKKLLVEIYYEN